MIFPIFRYSFWARCLSLSLISLIIWLPVQRAHAQVLNSSTLGAALLVRSGPALAGARLLLGLGPAALAGVGLGLAAIAIYDKYIDPTGTDFTDVPVAQVNLDQQSRILSDIEKAAGFTNNSTTGSQTVTPPNTSSAYPPLWSGTGTAQSAGATCAAQGNPPGVWSTNAAGTAQYNAYAPSLGQTLASFNTVGYANPTTTGGTCSVGSVTYVVLVRTNKCSFGYSGASCTLSNAAGVTLPMDGTCQIKRTGNSFAVDNLDPDCTPQPGKSIPLPTFSNSNGTLSFVSAPNFNGKPSLLTIDASNGQVTATVSTPNTTTPTYSNLVVGASVPNATGGNTVITTTTITNTNGIGASAPTTTTTTGDINVEVNLPDNLAKSEDVAAVRDSIESLKDTPNAPYTPPSSNFPTDLNSIESIVGTGSSLPSIFSFNPMLPTSVTAPPIVFQLAGNTVNMNIETWLNYIRTFLGILLYTLTPFTVFSIISSRRQD